MTAVKRTRQAEREVATVPDAPAAGGSNHDLKGTLCSYPSHTAISPTI